MFYTNKKFSLTKTLVISALMLAASVGINYFRFYIPIAGTQSVRVGLGGPFLKFVGILFGPVWGGTVTGMSDLINYLMKPDGMYIWQLTIVAFLNGFNIAFLWHTIKKINFNIFKTCYIAVFSVLAVLGVFNLAYTGLYPESAYAIFFEKRLVYISVGFIVTGTVGLAIYFLARYLLRGKYEIYFERFIKLIISVGIPGLIFTTVNTVILIKVLGWPTPFIIVWIPRVIEQIMDILYNTSVLIMFYGIYEKTFQRIE